MSARRSIARASRRDDWRRPWRQKKDYQPATRCGWSRRSTPCCIRPSPLAVRRCAITGRPRANWVISSMRFRSMTAKTSLARRTAARAPSNASSRTVARRSGAQNARGEIEEAVAQRMQFHSRGARLLRRARRATAINTILRGSPPAARAADREHLRMTLCSA